MVRLGDVMVPSPPAVRRRVVVGVDLGQLRTPAALAVMEVRDGEPVWDAVRWGWSPGLQGDWAVLRFVEALPLGTTYTAVAGRVWEVALAASASTVCFDATGVGNAVVELLRQARPEGLKCGLRGVVLTGGREVVGDHVPRWVLVQRLAVDWACGRVGSCCGGSYWGWTAPAGSGGRGDGRGAAGAWRGSGATGAWCEAEKSLNSLGGRLPLSW